MFLFKCIFPDTSNVSTYYYLISYQSLMNLIFITTGCVCTVFNRSPVKAHMRNTFALCSFLCASEASSLSSPIEATSYNISHDSTKSAKACSVFLWSGGRVKNNPSSEVLLAVGGAVGRRSSMIDRDVSSPDLSYRGRASFSYTVPI